MELAVPAQFYPIHICIPRKSQSLWKTYVGDGMESGMKISRGPMPYTLDHLPIESNLHIHEFDTMQLMVEFSLPKYPIEPCIHKNKNFKLIKWKIFSGNKFMQLW